MAERDDLQAAVKEWTRQDPDFPLLMRAFEWNYQLLDALMKTREVQGLTQREVARRMGTSQSAIDRIEGGEVDPRLSTVQRLAVAIGRVVEWRLVNPHEVANPLYSGWASPTGILLTPQDDAYRGLWNSGSNSILSAHGLERGFAEAAVLTENSNTAIAPPQSSSKGRVANAAQPEAA